MNVPKCFAALGLSLTCCGVSSAWAAQSQAAQAAEEDRIAQAEDEADGNTPLSKQAKMEYTGTLTLNPEDAPPNPFGVVGTLEATDGKKYGVKLAEPGLLKLLAPFNEKNVTVEAKPRVKGKYLVVVRIVVITKPPNRELPARPGL